MMMWIIFSLMVDWLMILKDPFRHQQKTLKLNETSVICFTFLHLIIQISELLSADYPLKYCNLSSMHKYSLTGLICLI